MITHEAATKFYGQWDNLGSESPGTFAGCLEGRWAAYPQLLPALGGITGTFRNVSWRGASTRGALPG
jgi:hypothetical protein